LFDEKQLGKRQPDTHRDTTKQLLDELTTNLNKARAEFYHAVDASWQSGLTGPAGYLTEVSTTSRKLAKTARESVDKLYPYCGLQAANPDTEISQTWRDLHTASQHSLLNTIGG
jgi:hypothetical protein